MNKLESTIEHWRKLRLLFFVSIVVVVLIPSISNLMKEIEKKYHDCDKSSWAATNYWIESSECMRRTGAWLVICKGDHLIPIEDRSLADDFGHALLLGVTASILNKKMRVVDVVRLNAWINVVGLLALLSLLFAVRADIVWIILLSLSGKIFFSWTGFSPHPGLIGTAALVSILPLILLAYEKKALSSRGAIVFGIIGLVSLSLSSLIRGAIGHMGLIITLSTLFLIGWKHRRHFRMLTVLLFIGLLVIVAWQSPRWLLMARNKLFNIQPSAHAQRHGISHNLYIGLGTIPNKFGIKWLDDDAARAVQKVRPGTTYASPEYFSVLWDLYLEHVRESPREVVRIYWEKAKKLISWLPLYMSVLVGLLLFILMNAKKNNVMKYTISASIVTVSLAFILFFLIQGILASPSLLYAAPIGVFTALIAGVALELGGHFLMNYCGRFLVSG